jgi:hypothetical protein
MASEGAIKRVAAAAIRTSFFMITLLCAVDYKNALEGTWFRAVEPRRKIGFTVFRYVPGSFGIILTPTVKQDKNPLYDLILSINAIAACGARTFPS